MQKQKLELYQRSRFIAVIMQLWISGICNEGE